MNMENESIIDYIDIHIRMVVQLDYCDIPLIPFHPRPCPLLPTLVLRNSGTPYERQQRRERCPEDRERENGQYLGAGGGREQCYPMGRRSSGRCQLAGCWSETTTGKVCPRRGQASVRRQAQGRLGGAGHSRSKGPKRRQEESKGAGY
jgi:hypothetical protein